MKKEATVFQYMWRWEPIVQNAMLGFSLGGKSKPEDVANKTQPGRKV